MTESSFFWRSRLSEERKREICEWYNSLPKEQQAMVDDIRHDGYQEGVFDTEESAGYDA